tara:strand:+ start:1543 stop:1668 length:126 start_codon:yes stop_codon:yes gene_type:complete
LKIYKKEVSISSWSKIFQKFILLGIHEYSRLFDFINIIIEI